MSGSFMSTGRTVMDEEWTNSITPLKQRRVTETDVLPNVRFQEPSLSEGGLYQADKAMRQSVSQSIGGVHRQSAMASDIIYPASL